MSKPHPFLGFNFQSVKGKTADERLTQFQNEFGRWLHLNAVAQSVVILPDVVTVRNPVEGMIAWDYVAHKVCYYNGTSWI